MFSAFNWQQMTSAFIVLFAVIDIIGSIPIIINLKEKGKDVNALKATLISFALLIGFFYAGDMMLKLFHVDIESFAVPVRNQIFLSEVVFLLLFPLFLHTFLTVFCHPLVFLPHPECASFFLLLRLLEFYLFCRKLLQCVP